MANLTIPTGGSATFPSGIYQLETVDPVLGGASGVSNTQAKQLGERTEYLKYRVDNPTAPDNTLGTSNTNAANTKFVIANAGRYSAVRIVTRINGGTTTTNVLTDADAGSLLYANPLNDLIPTVTLPTISTIPQGQYIGFTNGSNKPMVVDAGITAIRINGSVTKNIVYVMPGESLCLVRVGGEWYPIHKEGNFDSVGEITFLSYYSFTVPTGFLELNGQTVNREDYPRLWEMVDDYNLVNMVSEASWSANKGKFSDGNGTTTFRLPDLRGQFIRSFDNAAGIDSGRLFATAQLDDFKAHTHDMKKDLLTDGSGGGFYAMNDSGSDGVETTESTGGTETRPKNMAYCAVIKY